MALRSVPIYRSGHRPILFMGGDQEMLMVSGIAAAAMTFGGQTWFALGFSVVLWFGMLWACRRMAKIDPLMRFVYLRHRLYRAYYPARSTAFRVNTSEQERQYR